MSYEIGYGKPPAKNRWQKGKSGNPGGSSRKSRCKSGPKDFSEEFADALRGKVYVTNGSKRVKITRARALFEKIYKDAFDGDPKSRELIFKFELQHDQDTRQGRPGEAIHVIVTGGLPD